MEETEEEVAAVIAEIDKELADLEKEEADDEDADAVLRTQRALAAAAGETSSVAPEVSLGAWDFRALMRIGEKWRRM